VSDADITHAKGEERAKRGYAWALGRLRRAHQGAALSGVPRSLEEAMELCTDAGPGPARLHPHRASTWPARKIGDTKIEIGDTRLCLDILAENLGLSVDGCYTSCLTRIQFLDPEKCRAKDDAKVEFGLI
jgi:hypothetical protein